MTTDGGFTGPKDAARLLHATELLSSLDDDSIERLAAELEEVSLSAGEVLFSEKDAGGSLYIVVSGLLEASVDRPGGIRAAVGQIGPGETVGEIHFVTGGVRSATVSAISDSRLLKLPRSAVARFIKQDAQLLEGLAAVVLRRLRRNQLAAVLTDLFGTIGEDTLGTIEDEVEWVDLPAGEMLFRQGDPGDSLYVVISGRLRAITVADDGTERVVGELLRGETVGEMTILSGEPRSASVRSMRDAQLVRLSRDGFDRLHRRYPEGMMQLARTVIGRLRAAIHSTPPVPVLANVAVVGASPDVPLSELCRRLAAAFPAADRVRHLSGDGVDAELGTPGGSRASEGNRAIRLATWLDEQESRHDIVLYEADPGITQWTLRCIRRADQILIVAHAASDAAAGEIRTLLASPEGGAGTSQQTLVLLHPDGSRQPSGTRRWLDSWPVDRHLHVRWDRSADVARLARFVAGRPVGLVLGGGGARGFAHIGVIRALEEASLPIDLIGGTSMGSLIAGEYALGCDSQSMISINEDLFARRSFDFTLPAVSLLAGRRVSRILRSRIGDVSIEDLWVPYFSVSSNLSRAEIMVHRSAPLRAAIRASGSLPGLVPPVFHDGELLVDGALLDNLPIDVMRGLCHRGPVVAVDVSAEVDLSGNPPFEESLSGWRVVWNKMNPLSPNTELPSLASILGRSGELASVRAQREIVRRAAADLYLRPPVDRFGMLEFAEIREIAEVGYSSALPVVQKWLAGRGPSGTVGD